MGVTIEVTPGLVVGQGTTLVFPARAADKPPKIHHFTTKEIGIFKKPPPPSKTVWTGCGYTMCLHQPSTQPCPCWGTSRFGCTTSDRGSNTAANIADHRVWGILANDIWRMNPFIEEALQHLHMNVKHKILHKQQQTYTRLNILLDTPYTVN
jgi:hypothetical protein